MSSDKADPEPDQKEVSDARFGTALTINEYAMAVDSRELTESMATTAAVYATRSTLTVESVRLAISLLLQSESEWSHERRFIFSRILLEVCRNHWGEDLESPWRVAGAMVIEVVKRSQLDRYNKREIEFATRVSDRHIELLRATLDRDALIEALGQGGTLAIGAYLTHAQDDSNPLTGINRWLYRSGFETRHIRTGYNRTTGSRFEPNQIDLTSITNKALAQLEEAYALSTGPQRGLAGCLLINILVLLDSIYPDRNLIGRILEIAEECIYLIDTESEPIGYIQLYSVLHRHGRRSAPESFEELFGKSIDAFLETNGEATTATVLQRAIAGLFTSAAALNELYQHLWSVTKVRDEDQLQSLLSLLIHHHPDNLFPCEPTARPVADRLREIDQENPTPSQWAATAVHAAAHASDGEENQVLTALEDARAAYATAGLPRELILDRMAYAKIGALVSRYVQSADYRRAISECVRAIRPVEALRSSRETITLFDMLRAARPPEIGPDLAGRWAKACLRAAGVLLPRLRASSKEGVARYFQNLGVLTCTDLTLSESAADDIYDHHRIFKGLDASAVLVQPRAHELLPSVSALVAKIAEAEKDEGVSAGDDGDDFFWGDGLPAGLDTLAYATTSESRPQDRPSPSAGKLRQRLDAWITHILLGQTDDWYSVDDVSVPLAELQRHLPIDTVFISHFLGEHRPDGEGWQDPQTLMVTVCISRHWSRAWGMKLRSPGATVSVLQDDVETTLTYNEHAYGVAIVREAVQEDSSPLPFTAHAREELLTYYSAMGTPPPDFLQLWAAQGIRHLCFWPHGPLHYVPFPALGAGDSRLADFGPITTVPHPSVLTRPRTPKNTPRLLAVGASGGQAPAGLATKSATELDAEIHRHTELIADVFSPCDLLVGDSATPARFLAAAPEYRYIHLTAHGTHDVSAPWLQTIFLNTGSGQEGRLHAYQILELDLQRVDVVTLSACESALGRFDLCDNLRGFTAALFSTGVSAVVGALWPIEPKVATVFFSAFYRGLKNGTGKLQAFRYAQIETRRAYPAARHWAAFTFSGDWRDDWADD